MIKPSSIPASLSQDEAETLREELTFKDHRLLEMEEAVKREKEQVSLHEAEVQSLLDKLTLEVEKNTRLSLELQEGRNGSEVRKQLAWEGSGSVYIDYLHYAQSSTIASVHNTSPYPSLPPSPPSLPPSRS